MSFMGRARLQEVVFSATMARAPRAAFVVIGVLILVATSTQAFGLWPRMPWTSAATASAGAAFGLVAYGLAFGPAPVASWLARHSAADVSRPAHAWALLLLLVGVFVSVVFGAFVGGVAAYESEIVLGMEAPALREADVLSNVVLSAIIFVVPAWTYVRVVHAASAPAAWRMLGLAPMRPERDALVGLALGGAFLLVLSVASAGLSMLGLVVPENERALEIAGSVSVAGAVMLSVGAAIGEEVFFRGFLQPRIGVVGQALVFMSGHLAYLNVLELVVTFSLALAFGLAYKRSGSLVGPMVAHFVFNVVMLVGARWTGAV